MIKSGQGADAALQIIMRFSAGKLAEEHDLWLRVRGHTRRRGRIRSRQRKSTMIPAASRPSSVMSGRPTRAATTSTGMSFSGTMVTRPLRSYPIPTMQPLGSDNPRDLWKWMQAYEDKTGGNVLAIAHNGNLSNGRMFPLMEFFTNMPVDRGYVE